jgi:hypothetical protein
MLDKSDQERSHQEPDSVDSRTSNDGVVLILFIRSADLVTAGQLVCRERILETVALSDKPQYWRGI